MQPRLQGQIIKLAQKHMSFRGLIKGPGGLKVRYWTTMTKGDHPDSVIFFHLPFPSLISDKGKTSCISRL
jgi:hypothetical protein